MGIVDSTHFSYEKPYHSCQGYKSHKTYQNYVKQIFIYVHEFDSFTGVISSSRKGELFVRNDICVKEIKQIIQSKFGLNATNQTLLIGKNVLYDDNTIGQYNIMDGSNIICFMKYNKKIGDEYFRDMQELEGTTVQLREAEHEAKQQKYIDEPNDIQVVLYRSTQSGRNIIRMRKSKFKFGVEYVELGMLCITTNDTDEEIREKIEKQFGILRRIQDLTDENMSLLSDFRGKLKNNDVLLLH